VLTRSRPGPEDRAAERRARAKRIANQRPGPTLHNAVMGGSTAIPAPPARQKTPGKVRQAIRDSARGEACTVRIPGICTNDPATTIWSHARWPDAGKGGSTKALDLCGAFACTACDAVYDGQRPPPAGITRAQVDADWCAGHFRSLVRLAQKGLL
jgi:hypothetical protein